MLTLVINFRLDVCVCASDYQRSIECLLPPKTFIIKINHPLSTCSLVKITAPVVLSF